MFLSKMRSAVRVVLLKRVFVLIVMISISGAAFAQADTSKMAWPPGTTQKQKAAYQHFFRKIEHPPAYYDLPVDKQMQFDINMHRNKSLRSKAWMLVGLGAAFAGVGAAIPVGENDAHTNVIFYCLGGATALTSIPLFVKSSKSGKKAQAIIAAAPNGTSFLRFTPQLGIRLQL